MPMEDTEKIRPLSQQIDAHTDSQRLRQQAEGLRGSAPDGVLEPKGEVDTCPRP